MGRDQLKDKAIFVVGLMAAFLAFSAYKQELSATYIQIGNSVLSLSGLFLTFVIFLALSVYFYAVDYLKFSFPKFQNSLIFKITSFFGNFFYSFAILFPILVLLLWISSSFPKPSPEYTIAIIIFDILGVTVISIGAILNAFAQLKRNRRFLIESIDKKRSRSLQRALKLFNNEFYGETIIEIFKVLESLLGEELLERVGLSTQGMSGGKIIDLANKHEILDKETLTEARILQEMRNKAAHTGIPFSREEAENSLNIIRSILSKAQDISKY